MSQSELARRAGVTQGYVAKIEAGMIKRPGLERVHFLARVLGTRLSTLLDPVQTKEEELNISLRELLAQAGFGKHVVDALVKASNMSAKEQLVSSLAEERGNNEQKELTKGRRR